MNQKKSHNGHLREHFSIRLSSSQRLVSANSCQTLHFSPFPFQIILMNRFFFTSKVTSGFSFVLLQIFYSFIGYEAKKGRIEDCVEGM